MVFRSPFDLSEVYTTLDILEFFSQNYFPHISPHLIWEPHMVIIKGKQMPIASCCNKQRAQKAKELTTTIKHLETLHERSLSDAHLSQLTSLEEELKTQLLLLERKIKPRISAIKSKYDALFTDN